MEYTDDDVDDDDDDDDDDDVAIDSIRRSKDLTRFDL